MNHPSFFLCRDLKRGDGGSLPGDEPSSLSEFAGTVFALPGEHGLFLNGGTPPNNNSGLSSTAGICRKLAHTSDTESQQPTNNMTSNLQTVRSHDKNSVPLLSFQLSAGLSIEARSCRFGLLFILTIVQGNQQKNGPPLTPQSKKVGQKTAGSTLFCKDGAV